MDHNNGECGAVRPGYSATFNACMRGAGHKGLHINPLGAKWSDEQRATAQTSADTDRR